MCFFDNHPFRIVHAVLHYSSVDYAVTDLNGGFNAHGEPFFRVVGFAAGTGERHAQTLLIQKRMDEVLKFLRVQVEALYQGQQAHRRFKVRWVSMSVFDALLNILAGVADLYQLARIF